jgi:hypothetical protein
MSRRGWSLRGRGELHDDAVGSWPGSLRTCAGSNANRAPVGTVALIDMLKEAALRTGCLGAATSVGARSGMDPAVLAERLLLCVYGYGTNTGSRPPRPATTATARTTCATCAVGS